jgi:drug/metabolite transporter (DMT)-like permease
VEKLRISDLGAIALAMLAFAGNSLLCRLALRDTEIDAASFTSVRMAAGALFLALLIWRRSGSPLPPASWPSALALWGYAAAFSYAYLGLTAATGALILFGSVQIGMTAAGAVRGERPGLRQTAGILLALGGMVYLLLPGVAAPPLSSAVLMITAGVAWAIYSLRGKKSGDPLATTAGNFRLAVLPALVLSLATYGQASLDPRGLLFAALSGAITSGAGYAVWYSVLPKITATQAATVQLTVPVIAALGAILLLGEAPTLRLAIAAVVVLGGVAMTLRRQPISAATGRT